MSISRGMDKEDVVHIYSGLLLSHKKEWNWVICRDVGGPRDCQTKWRKKEKHISYTNAYMWNLEKWYSVQFSPSVVSNSLTPHGPQHARLLCPSPTPRAYSNSCPLSRWCYLTISSSVSPSSSCPQSFPGSGSFSMSQLFSSGGQSIGVSNFQSFQYSGLISFRIDWLDLLVVQGTLKSRLQHHSSKVSILRRSAFFIVQLSLLYMTTGKTIALTRQTFVGKGSFTHH